MLSFCSVVNNENVLWILSASSPVRWSNMVTHCFFASSLILKPPCTVEIAEKSQTRGLRSAWDQSCKKNIKELIELDIIEPAQGPTPWVNPIVVVPKSGGNIRLCIDMWRAYEAIWRARHPIPTVDEITQSIIGSKVFFKFDLKWVYHFPRIPWDYYVYYPLWSVQILETIIWCSLYFWTVSVQGPDGTCGYRGAREHFWWHHRTWYRPERTWFAVGESHCEIKGTWTDPQCRKVPV